LQTIEITEQENILSHVKDVGPYLQSRATELLKHEIVGDVRGSHLMLGIDLVSDRETKEGFTPEQGSAQLVFETCREMGVIIRPIGDRIVISPPLVLTKSDCDTIIEALDQALKKVTPVLLSG